MTIMIINAILIYVSIKMMIMITNAILIYVFIKMMIMITNAIFICVSSLSSKCANIQTGNEGCLSNQHWLNNIISIDWKKIVS